MKAMIITTLIVSTVLASLTAVAAPEESRDLSDILAKGVVKADSRADLGAQQTAVVASKVSSISKGQADSTALRASLALQFPSNDGRTVSGMEIAQDFIKSNDVINDSNEVGNNLSKSDQKHKEAILEANEVGSAALGIFPGRMNGLTTQGIASKGGLAASKLLLVLSRAVRDRLSTEQTNSYTSVAKEMLEIMRDPNIGTEAALTKALTNLGFSADQKIEELLGCKI